MEECKRNQENRTSTSQEATPQKQQQLVLCRVSRVKFAQGALRDSLQHLFGEDSEQLPANVQSLVDSAVFIGTLKN
jgi:hypothetical protein